jgi:aspartate oxidase
MSAEIQDIARAPVIIGGGIAGLMTALRLAPLPVVVLTKTPLGTEASSGSDDVALMITMAALRREESRGAHFRTDFPQSHAAALHRAALGLQEAVRAAQDMMSFIPEARRARHDKGG